MLLGRTEDAGVYYQKSLDAFKQMYEQTGTVEVLMNLSVSWSNMGDHLRSLGRTEEAGEHYRKSLDTAERIYGQTGTVEALKDLIISHDKIGDNKHALGLPAEAHAHRLKALELFEQRVKLDPSLQKYDSYYRDKAKRSGEENKQSENENKKNEPKRGFFNKLFKK